jgi:hypothetical protein
MAKKTRDSQARMHVRSLAEPGRRHDGLGHLNAIGFVDEAAPMFAKAGIAREPDEGVANLKGGAAAFIQAAMGHRIWAREPALRSPH